MINRSSELRCLAMIIFYLKEKSKGDLIIRTCRAGGVRIDLYKRYVHGSS